MNKIIILLALLLLAGLARAETVLTVGTVSTGWTFENNAFASGSFTFDGGTNWTGTHGGLFTRRWIAPVLPSYGIRNGCNVCLSNGAEGYWLYSRTVVPAVVVQSGSGYSSGYQNQILSAKDFNAEALRIIERENENDAKLQVIQELNQRRRARLGGGSGSLYGQSYLQSLTTTGTTLYGYSGVNSLSHTDPAVDANALLLQYAQTVQNGQNLQSLAVGGLKDLSSQAQDNALALENQRQRFATALQLMQGTPYAKTQTSTFNFGSLPPAANLPAANGAPATIPKITDEQGATSPQAKLANFFGTSCAKCHSDSTAKDSGGGFSLQTWPTLTPAKQQLVIQRMLLPVGDSKHMPLNGKEAARNEDIGIVVQNLHP